MLAVEHDDAFADQVEAHGANLLRCLALRAGFQLPKHCVKRARLLVLLARVRVQWASHTRVCVRRVHVRHLRHQAFKYCSVREDALFLEALEHKEDAADFGREHGRATARGGLLVQVQRQRVQHVACTRGLGCAHEFARDRDCAVQRALAQGVEKDLVVPYIAHGKHGRVSCFAPCATFDSFIFWRAQAASSGCWMCVVSSR